MSRLNGIVKFVMINVNIFMAVIGIVLFGFAMYLWCSDWGNLDRGFFVGSGLVICLFGFCLILLGCIGCLGVDHQGRIKKPCLESCTNKWYSINFTARKIVAVHLVVMIFAFIGEIVLLRMALNASKEYENLVDTYNEESLVDQPYATFENYLAKEFNRFFFGAISDCNKTLYLWFFDWVNHNCPESISQQNCQGCFDYSFTFCAADESQCYASSTTGNIACPYTICRYGVLNYFYTRIERFGIALLVIVGIQLFLILFDLMILCYREHDNKAVMLLKAGTDFSQLREHHEA